MGGAIKHSFSMPPRALGVTLLDICQTMNNFFLIASEPPEFTVLEPDICPKFLFVPFPPLNVGTFFILNCQLKTHAQRCLPRSHCSCMHSSSTFHLSTPIISLAAFTVIRNHMVFCFYNIQELSFVCLFICVLTPVLKCK